MYSALRTHWRSIVHLSHTRLFTGIKEIPNAMKHFVTYRTCNISDTYLACSSRSYSAGLSQDRDNYYPRLEYTIRYVRLSDRIVQSSNRDRSFNCRKSCPPNAAKDRVYQMTRVHFNPRHSNLLSLRIQLLERQSKVTQKNSPGIIFT